MSCDTFKNRLKVVMNGESNHSFAKKCELSEGTIRRYLKGNAFPSLDTMETIAKVSGYSLSWLASGHGPKKMGDTPNSYADENKQADSLKKCLLNGFTVPPPDELKAVLLKINDIHYEMKTEAEKMRFLGRIMESIADALEK